MCSVHVRCNAYIDIFDKTVVVMHMQLYFFFFDRLLDTSTESVLCVLCGISLTGNGNFLYGTTYADHLTHQEQDIQIGFHNWWLLSLLLFSIKQQVLLLLSFFSITIHAKVAKERV